MNALRALQVYARKAPGHPRPSCELCRAALEGAHAHVVDLERRALRCACRSCAILFDQGQGEGRFRRVPDRVLRAPSLSAARWAELGVPVRLAFVFFNSRVSRFIAAYPSPGGAMESEVPAEKWEELARDHPVLRGIAPDVEALLVWGPKGSVELQCFVVPVDVCYELVAICRTRFQGFEGGDDLKRELAAFFARLDGRASREDR